MKKLNGFNNGKNALDGVGGNKIKWFENMKEINLKNPIEDACIIYVDNAGNELSRDYEKRTNNIILNNLERENTVMNYVYTEPNSHFFTDLSQILESCKYKRDYEELIIGLENSIKQDYKMTQNKLIKRDDIWYRFLPEEKYSRNMWEISDLEDRTNHVMCVNAEEVGLKEAIEKFKNWIK